MANEDRHALCTCGELPGSSGQRSNWALHYLAEDDRPGRVRECGLPERRQCLCSAECNTIDGPIYVCSTYMAENGGGVEQGSPRSECSTLQLMWVTSSRLQLRHVEKVD